MYAFVKSVHIVLALVTVSGFLLRAWWSYQESSLLEARVVRILPHIIDSLFLASGFALIILASWPVMQSPWLLAKFAGLIAYILFGTVAIRRGRSRRIRLAATAAALLAFLYVVGAASLKSAMSWAA